MGKVSLFLMLWLLAFCTCSSSIPLQATDAVQDAMRNMNAFNPAVVIPSYEASPPESNLKLNEDGTFGEILNAGARRAEDDDTTRFITTQNATRGKITPNPQSEVMLYAERLIDTADAEINTACHFEPVPCLETYLDKTCEESMTHALKSCRDNVTVHVHQLHFPAIARFFLKNATTLDVTSCARFKNIQCSAANEITLHARCEHLETQVSHAGKPLALLKAPTCDDPSLTVDLNTSAKLTLVTIQVTEHWSDADEWSHTDCTSLTQSTPNGACVPESIDACLEPNQTKVIEGIPVTRRCWGRAETYRCPDGVFSTCGSLLDKGCSNTSSVCTAMNNNVCEHVSKTFQCTEKTCFPDKEVCASQVGCADGSCDLTQTDVSDDANEGFSRLGALAGVAEDASFHQTQTGQPTIFKGEPQECEKYLLGTRDCCTDNGFLDGLIHCPAEMQPLQQAKNEKRVVELGHYKHHVFGTTRYVYCVFPTKLARIIQFDGRQGQLHIPFGTPKYPDCRGLTPEQLESMDFKQFDLSEFIQDVTDKTTLPADNASDTPNTAHVESMFDRGIPHD